MFNDFDLGTMTSQTLNIVPVMEQAAALVPDVPLHEDDRFLDFEKNKVQPLSLEQLRRTLREHDAEKGDAIHGITHVDLIDGVMDICRSYNYAPEIYDMFATNNRDKMTPGVSVYPELEAQYGPKAVEAHTIRRLFVNIRLRDFDTEELTTNIAVSYTQRGLQIGIGRNVVVCHNQCMLSAEHYVADFTMADHKGTHKTPADMLATVRQWMRDLRNIIAEDDECIERMRRAILTPAQVLLVIGMLTAARVQADTNHKDIKVNNVYPLNQAQISKFTEALLIRQHHNGRLSAWDMYNAATDIYKPQTAEQTMILPQNMAFVNFLRSNNVI